MGKFSDAKPLFLQALTIRKKVFGEEHPENINLLSGLGQLYEATGNYMDAEDFYLQAMKLCKKTLGETHPDYGITLDEPC